MDLGIRAPQQNPPPPGIAALLPERAAASGSRHAAAARRPTSHGSGHPCTGAKPTTTGTRRIVARTCRCARSPPSGVAALPKDPHPHRSGHPCTVANPPPWGLAVAARTCHRPRLRHAVRRPTPHGYGHPCTAPQETHKPPGLTEPSGGSHLADLDARTVRGSVGGRRGPSPLPLDARALPGADHRQGRERRRLILSNTSWKSRAWGS